MIFEELSVHLDSDFKHVHVNDFDVVVDSREGEHRRLAFITAKLGSSAMQDVKLGADFDEMSQSDFELAA